MDTAFDTQLPSEEQVSAQSFYHVMHALKWEELAEQIGSKTAADVERALGNAGHASIEDMKALLSPAALPYLKRMAEGSHRRATRGGWPPPPERFLWVMDTRLGYSLLLLSSVMRRMML